MKMTTPRTVLFGPYALDMRSGELRKFGTKVKMGDQAFQILRMLLETPGEMVTREELRTKLWANDTFVDFDHGLNSAVQRLRDCLSDSAGNPRWVETIPRRGYRFVGQVQWTDEVITMLAKIPGLRITSRTSVMQYKRVHRPLREIAQQLGVDGILEGSVVRTGNRVHLTAQLIHAASDTHLWAETFDGDLSDV